MKYINFEYREVAVCKIITTKIYILLHFKLRSKSLKFSFHDTKNEFILQNRINGDGKYEWNFWIYYAFLCKEKKKNYWLMPEWHEIVKCSFPNSFSFSSLFWTKRIMLKSFCLSTNHYVPTFIQSLMLWAACIHILNSFKDLNFRSCSHSFFLFKLNLYQ